MADKLSALLKYMYRVTDEGSVNDPVKTAHYSDSILLEHDAASWGDQIPTF
jgi:hypothetical protein